MYVPPNRYLSYLSCSSDGEDILGEFESDTCCTRSTGSISTRSKKARKIFRRHMQYFISNRGSCNYDAERIGDIEFPLRYRHLVQRWVPNKLPQVDIDFFINGRMYHITPLSLHGLGLFSKDGIKVSYGTITELMEYFKPLYRYNNWLILVQYTRSMRRYGVAANYIQLAEHNKKQRGDYVYWWETKSVQKHCWLYK